MKIAIVGSAAYRNLEAVRRFVRSLERGTVVIVPGGVGVSQSAFEEALESKLKHMMMPPRSPGTADRIDQVKDIIKTCDSLVAFWDGTDENTKRFIDRAHEAGKLTKVYRPSGQ